MSAHLSNSLVLDGYRMIRFLGRGGFGEVWLCRSESMGDYRALKFIPSSHADRLEKEYEALLHFRKAAARLRSPHLVSIEHVGHSEAGLYYVMPLADGSGAADPSDPAWVPVSLTTMIHERSEMPTWFSSREIIALIHPVLEALQTLSDAGLVHRDVKPENILFFNGQPCLGDISLLGADASVITRRGTLGYGAPSWYGGGLPDMYGVAATLFTLLTGNLPDRMGRAAFLWPPQGEASLSADERTEWKRLHGVIRRATEEKVAERFVDFRSMAGAFHLQSPSEVPVRKGLKPALMLSLGLVVCVSGYWFVGRSEPKARPESLAPSAAVAPALTATEIAPVPADLPPIPEVTSKRFDDGHLVYGALAMAGSRGEMHDPNDPEEPVYMTTDENNLYQDMVAKVYDCILDANDLDFPTAIQVLDQCTGNMPGVGSGPNVQLARLLLQQCSDDRAMPMAAVDAPSFLVLGNDDLGYRVALFCALGAEAKAEEFLGNFVTKESSSAREKSEALVERGRVRAKLGRYADARTDVEESVALAGSNLALKTQLQNDIARIAKDIPAYADYLKSRSEK
jgi:serine/threonine protein kinase